MVKVCLLSSRLDQGNQLSFSAAPMDFDILKSMMRCQYLYFVKDDKASVAVKRLSPDRIYIPSCMRKL